jgi:hypothetical protein
MIFSHEEDNVPKSDEEFIKERDKLFLKPTLKGAQKYWSKNFSDIWLRPDVPLAAIHKSRLQWIEATDVMLKESEKWLIANGYSTSFKGVLPLTPDQRDAERVQRGLKPLKVIK